MQRNADSKWPKSFLSRRKGKYQPRKSDRPYVIAIGNLDVSPNDNDDNNDHNDNEGNEVQQQQEEEEQKQEQKQKQQHEKERNLQSGRRIKSFPIEISSDTYISNSYGVVDVKKLKSLNVTHILNVGGKSAVFHGTTIAFRKAGIIHKVIEGMDIATYPMLENHWDECREFLAAFRNSNKAKEGGKCVIHCHAGVNRSGLIVAADYMVTYRKNVLETMKHCRECYRGNNNTKFLTNRGFQRQLVALARQEGLLGPIPPPSLLAQPKNNSDKSKTINNDHGFQCVPPHVEHAADGKGLSEESGAYHDETLECGGVMKGS